MLDNCCTNHETWFGFRFRALPSELPHSQSEKEGFEPSMKRFPEHGMIAVSTTKHDVFLHYRRVCHSATSPYFVFNTVFWLSAWFFSQSLRLGCIALPLPAFAPSRKSLSIWLRVCFDAPYWKLHGEESNLHLSLMQWKKNVCCLCHITWQLLITFYHWTTVQYCYVAPTQLRRFWYMSFLTTFCLTGANYDSMWPADLNKYFRTLDKATI